MPGTWVGRLSRYRLRPDRWTRGENARRSDEERSPGSPRKREMSRPAAEHRADGVPVRLRADVGTTAEVHCVVAAQAAPPGTQLVEIGIGLRTTRVPSEDGRAERARDERTTGLRFILPPSPPSCGGPIDSGVARDPVAGPAMPGLDPG